VVVAAPVVHLHVRTAIGTVKVWLPNDVHVEVDGSTRIGSRRVDVETSERGVPGPMIHLHIDTGLGTVKVFRG
jgi:predicted membrane protein